MNKKTLIRQGENRQHGNLYQQTVQMFSPRVLNDKDKIQQKAEKGVQTVPVNHQMIISQYMENISNCQKKGELISMKQQEKIQELQTLRDIQTNLSQNFDINDVSSSKEKYQKNMDRLSVSIEQNSQLEEQLSQLKNSLSSSGVSSLQELTTSTQLSPKVNIAPDSHDIHFNPDHVSNSIKQVIYTNQIYNNYKQLLIKEQQQAQNLIIHNKQIFSPNLIAANENVELDKYSTDQDSQKVVYTTETSDNKTPQSNDALLMLKNEYKLLTCESQRQHNMINELNNCIQITQQQITKLQNLLTQKSGVLQYNQNIAQKCQCLLNDVNQYKKIEQLKTLQQKHSDDINQLKLLESRKQIIKQIIKEKLDDAIANEQQIQQQLQSELQNNQMINNLQLEENKQLNELKQQLKTAHTACNPQQLKQMHDIVNIYPQIEQENEEIKRKIQENMKVEYICNEQLSQIFNSIQQVFQINISNNNKSLTKVFDELQTEYNAVQQEIAQITQIFEENKINTSESSQHQLAYDLQTYISKHQQAKQQLQEILHTMQSYLISDQQQVQKQKQQLNQEVHQIANKMSNNLDEQINQLQSLLVNKNSVVQQKQTKIKEQQQQLEVCDYYINEYNKSVQLYGKILIEIQKCMNIMGQGANFNGNLLLDANINQKITKCVQDFTKLVKEQARSYCVQKSRLQNQIINNDHMQKIQQDRIKNIANQIVDRIQELQQQIEGSMQKSGELHQSHVQSLQSGISQLNDSNIHLSEQISMQQLQCSQQEEQLLKSQLNIEELEYQKEQYQKYLETQQILDEQEYNQLQLSYSDLNMYKINLESYQIIDQKQYKELCQSFAEYEQCKAKEQITKQHQNKNKIRLEQLIHWNDVLQLHMKGCQKYFDHLINIQLSRVKHSGQSEYQANITFIQHQLQNIKEITQTLVNTQKNIVPGSSPVKQPILVSGCKKYYELSLIDLQKIIRLLEQQFNKTYKLKFIHSIKQQQTQKQ